MGECSCAAALPKQLYISTVPYWQHSLSICHPLLPFIHPSLLCPHILVAAVPCGLPVASPLLSLAVNPPPPASNDLPIPSCLVQFFLFSRTAPQRIPSAHWSTSILNVRLIQLFSQLFWGFSATQACRCYSVCPKFFCSYCGQNKMCFQTKYC